MTGDYVTGEPAPGSRLSGPESASTPEVGTERGSEGGSGPQAGTQGFDGEPEPLEIPRDAAETLYAVLGDLLGETVADGTAARTALRELLALFARHSCDGITLGYTLTGAVPADDFERWSRAGEMAADDAHQVVVLCGSTRFMRAMDEADDALTCAGRIVVRPSLDLKAGRPAWVETDAECEALVQRLHDVHRAKIRMADRVLIVGNYMGESTRGEYEYAISLGKPVDFTHPEIDPVRNGEVS